MVNKSLEKPVRCITSNCSCEEFVWDKKVAYKCVCGHLMSTSHIYSVNSFMPKDRQKAKEVFTQLAFVFIQVSTLLSVLIPLFVIEIIWLTVVSGIGVLLFTVLISSFLADYLYPVPYNEKKRLDLKKWLKNKRDQESWDAAFSGTDSWGNPIPRSQPWDRY